MNLMPNWKKIPPFSKNKKKYTVLNVQSRLLQTKKQNLCKRYECITFKEPIGIADLTLDTHYFFNCRAFGMSGLFHTTRTSEDKKCTMENFVAAAKQNVKKLSDPASANLEKIVLTIFPLRNHICYLDLKKKKVITTPLLLEVRSDGVYIYNSFENIYSSAWFSGLTMTAALSPKSVLDAAKTFKDEKMFNKIWIKNMFNEKF